MVAPTIWNQETEIGGDANRCLLMPGKAKGWRPEDRQPDGK